ncbi:family 16 glycosylhydrolase (plasmid) [Pseudoalteromonas sp. T1lg65]|uniref:family 16 glycosylhydrolase n=1 Tax=Pseudoalteromonas sp. T1lg65 TaxID=2077101 RepID=UPI003F7B07F5
MSKATTLSMISLCALTTVLIGCGGGAETNTDTSKIDASAPVSDWQLVWSDEFDGSAIDTSKWQHEVNCAGGGNNEQQCYTDSSDNAYLNDGILHIVARQAADGAEKPFTSARLNTRYKADFTYGRFEVRAKLPSGQGAWPAFWMLPTEEVYGGWPKSGEIDILEAVNLQTATAEGGAENRVYGTLHYGKDWPDNVSSGKAYSLPDGMNPADDFHTYAIEWQEGEIRWYVDGYLYQTQRRSSVRYNSKDEAVGLSHRGWFAEYYNQSSGALTTHWDNAPFDQDFHLLLNLAVGGDWPENANELGVDADAFAQGQHFEIDYVRVYQCALDPETGKGCETVRGGYDSKEDALVEGKAPIPAPPSSGEAKNLDIFTGEVNPNWPAWDCCGGSTPSIVEDAERGNAYQFSVGAAPTVNGFISRAEFITDPNGKASPFDASPLIDSGTISFQMKVTSMPNNADAVWVMKIESVEAATAVEIPLIQSREGTEVQGGQWQTFTFELQALADKGLDISAIDVVMVFPAWGTGEGAVYLIDEMRIAGATGPAPLVIFENAVNPAWPMWDCCGGSAPAVVNDDDAHEQVAEFTIGDAPTVMGFISRAEFITADGVEPSPFDATAMLADGHLQFEMKVINMPNDGAAAWKLKVESLDAQTAVELDLTASVEAAAPTANEWQTYTFKLSDLADAGLDVSAIDVVMIFPAWGTGAGAVYRVDNVKIYSPTSDSGFNGHVLFADQVLDQWSLWDCCGGSTPTIENDDADHGLTAEYKIGAEPTVVGVFADDNLYLDAFSLNSNGVVQFEMKVLEAPADVNSVWKFKIESGDGSTAVELELTASIEGQAPVLGQWQTYTFKLQDLFEAGLDTSAIDVLMIFPAWGTGEGAVFRVDNIMIYDPASVPQAQGFLD